MTTQNRDQGGHGSLGSMTNDLAAALASETGYTSAQWQHALNALGGRTDLLPTVKEYAARQGCTPLTAAQDVLSAARRDGPPDG